MKSIAIVGLAVLFLALLLVPMNAMADESALVFTPSVSDEILWYDTQLPIGSGKRGDSGCWVTVYGKEGETFKTSCQVSPDGAVDVCTVPEEVHPYLGITVTNNSHNSYDITWYLSKTISAGEVPVQIRCHVRSNGILNDTEIDYVDMIFNGFHTYCENLPIHFGDDFVRQDCNPVPRTYRVMMPVIANRAWSGSPAQ